MQRHRHADGFPPPQQLIEGILSRFTQPGSVFTTSMLRDIEADAPSRPTRSWAISSTTPDATDLASPMLTIAHTHLRSYEERRKRQAQT